MKSLAFFLLFAAPVFGQATPEPPLAKPVVTLPAEIKGEVGEWIVIVPDKVYGGDVKWRIGAGLQPVDLGRLFPGIKPAGIVVKAKADGRYEIWAWNAKADVASDLAVVVVAIGKPVVQPPQPPDNPKPDPTPIPGVGAYWVIVAEPDGPLSQELAANRRDPIWDKLRKAGVHVSFAKLGQLPVPTREKFADAKLPSVLIMREALGADGKPASYIVDVKARPLPSAAEVEALLIGAMK